MTTKKEYIALADALRRANPINTDLADSAVAIDQYQRDVRAVADACESLNPRFNRSRWLAYLAGECGPSGGTNRYGRNGRKPVCRSSRY